MFDKLLVPIDSIEWNNTLNAVKTAIKFSKGCKVNGSPEIIFLHVFYIKTRTPVSQREKIIEEKAEEIEEDFETIRKMCEENGLDKIRTDTRDGNPAKEIIKVAKEENVDMITIGSGKIHDKSTAGKIHKFFYGSVTEEVIHESPCSIMVTRPKIEVNRILVPIDSIEWDNTLNAVNFALEFTSACADNENTKLMFTHVMHSPSKVSGINENEKLSLEKKRMNDEFYMIEEMCKKKNIENFETTMIEGDPDDKETVDEKIVEFALDQNIDLIVIGSGKLHDRSVTGKIKKFFYGSVTENVIHEAPCSILVASPLS